MRITPAIIVTRNRPDRPNWAMMPATTTTNAPVGPDTCTDEPPSTATSSPPRIAV
jgi:hypothetical protein